MDKDLMPGGESNAFCLEVLKMSPGIAEKWRELGQELGISSEKINAIGQKYRHSRQCFSQVMSAWLSRKFGGDRFKPVTIRTFARALESESVNESSVADKIVKMKGGKPTVPRPSPTTITDNKPAPREISPLPEPKLAGYLRTYYQRGSMKSRRGLQGNLDDDWPPSFHVEFISLLLAKQRKLLNLSRVKKTMALINEGEVEGMEGKIQIGNVIKPSKRVCLINGAPGVGKTRLALKLTQDWASGQQLKDFDLVLYIALRNPIARLSESLDDLLKYFGDENYNDGDKNKIEREQGKGVLFILDGWDELRQSCRDKSRFFPKLIAGIYLPGCSVAVTSRPGQSEDIQADADRVIEVLGFGKEQVNEYIQAYFVDDARGAELVKDLHNYPNVASTCYVAINLAIVCYVYYELDYCLPQTLTEVYKWFIIHTVLRYLKKKKVADDIQAPTPVINSTEDVFDSSRFDEEVKKIFKEEPMAVLNRLGELALDGLREDNLYFKRSDMLKTCNINSENIQFDGFGLLKSVQICHQGGVESYYHFLHLSIQEFIAAFHISHLDSHEQMRYLSHESRMEATIKFFSGLDQFKSQSLRIFIKNEQRPQLFHLECIYEGQWKDHCKVIAGKFSNKFTIDRSLQPQQWEVMGYVMSNSETEWEIRCRRVYIGRNSLACFTRHLSATALRNLYFERVLLPSDAISILSEICCSQKKLAEISIVYCDIDNKAMTTILEALKHHERLEILCIKDRTVTSTVLKAFLNLLPTLAELKEIELDMLNFSDENNRRIQHCASKCGGKLKVVLPLYEHHASLQELSPSGGLCCDQNTDNKSKLSAGTDTPCHTGGTGEDGLERSGQPKSVLVHPCEILRRLYSDLVMGIKHDIGVVSDRCYSHYLISETTHESIRMLNSLPGDKARMLLSNLEGTVQQDEEKIWEFVEVLRQVKCDRLADQLERLVKGAASL